MASRQPVAVRAPGSREQRQDSSLSARSSNWLENPVEGNSSRAAGARDPPLVYHSRWPRVRLQLRPDSIRFVHSQRPVTVPRGARPPACSVGTHADVRERTSQLSVRVKIQKKVVVT